MKSRKFAPFIFLLIALAVAGTFFVVQNDSVKVALYEAFYAEKVDGLASIAAVVTSPFQYFFAVNGTLAETGNMQDSSSPYWWLNSGAYFYLKNGVGMTYQGELPTYSKWRVAYANSNPRDTDNGYHPQNIFRLLTRSSWQNVQADLSFKINKINLSDSPERDAWSGVLLFSRYQDSDNLYYAGVRMDGHAVIKKKIAGKYYTIAEKTFWPGTYNRTTNPNLIPTGKWMALRMQTTNIVDGKVMIRLYVDENLNGQWKLAVEGADNVKDYGGLPHTKQGYTGVRTDFMDAEFDNYKVVTLK